MTNSRQVILIIDDNEENRYTFGRYLRHDDFEIWTAKTGEEGLALARKNPSLIMLDIQLPDTTGYELCRVLKSDPTTASIPVLHTSATFTESSDRAFGLEGGADGYLTQPIDAHELAATVRALLRIREAEQSAKSLAFQWQTTFDSISDSICLLNLSGKIERYNQAFSNLIQNTTGIQVGTPFNAVVRLLLPEPSDQLRDGSLPPELFIRNRWYRVTSDAIKDEMGNLTGRAWLFSDISILREAELNLQNLNSELEKRVSERTASLQEAVHQLEQFSYTVSHDLRAPLRAMKGYSDALLEDFSSCIPADAVLYLQRIVSNASRLDKMIIDVLTFTRVSQAAPVLMRLSLERIIQDIIEHYPGLKSPDAIITLDVRHEVLGNESGLTQALSNILGNAVKFVRKGVKPTIRIWSELNSGKVRLWIEDNGIGISPQYQARLFGMFERVLPAGEYEGTGVGLAIARKVVERMGGNVGLESDGHNGSKFWIELNSSEQTS